MADVEHKVLKYKSYLETNQNGNKVLYIFTRLTEMLITIDILQRTGIGKVVNSFRKKEGEIGQLAKDIVARWRSMVAEEALRLESEAEAKESDNQSEADSDSESESQQDFSADGDETKEEEINESENKYDKESDKSSCDIDKRKSSSKYDDKKQHENVQKGSKSNQVGNHGHHKQDNQLQKTEDNKHQSSHSKTSGSDSKHSKSDGKHSKSDSKHSSSDSKHSSSESKHKTSDGKNSSSVSKHKSSDSKHSSSDDKHSSSDSKHSKSDGKHSSSNSKHSSSDSKHSGSDSKHKSSNDKHSSSDSKHSTSDSKHSGSDGKKSSSDSKHTSSDSKHTSSDSKHSSSEKKQKSSDKKQDSSRSGNKSEEKTGNSRSEQKSSSSEKIGSASLKDTSNNDGQHVKSSIATPVSSEHNDKTEFGVGSDDDPLHWEMLETFEQIKSPNSVKSQEIPSHHEQLSNERKKSTDIETFTEQNPESEKKNHSSQALKDSKSLAEKRENLKDNDRDSKHKHREKSSKSHHSEQKESSTEKNKHRDETGHKNKHSKHKHKHSDKEKEHKHSKRDKSEKREEIKEKKESKEKTSEKEDLANKGQVKERPRSSILESISNEVEEGKFVSDDVPGLWFLNSNNNSLLAGKSDMESSKLKEPCESSKVKVDSHTSDKSQDYTNSSDKNLTSENDKKEKKRHKHSKDKESSSSKHKSHKDSKSKHDSKHHRDKKRKHSGDADDSKPSKSRRKSSQDGMSFEDLLTAGATDSKQSQPSKLSQNDYAKLKSKFKVKKKEDNSTTDSAKNEKTGAKTQIQVTEEDILGGLPQPNTHYRPWRLKEVEKKKTDEELLDEFIAATKGTGRTQMYSGKKQTFVPEVYKLFDMCMNVLCNNIDSLEFVGGVPFAILKPVLEKCTAAQLYRLEDFNPHFLEESDPLWMNHCHKEFRMSKPEEMESWREHYLRKFDEREEKLKKISANINASMAKKVPERTTQLAYIDSAAKPPRNVRRQQAKFGTAGPSSGERSRARFLPSMDPIPIGRPGSKAVKTSAPMMAKTLTMIKKMRR